MGKHWQRKTIVSVAAVATTALGVTGASGNRYRVSVVGEEVQGTFDRLHICDSQSIPVSIDGLNTAVEVS